jgi:tetratricopeptide (TPR) repeat protein
MQTTVNFRFLAWLLIAGIACGGAVHGLHVVQLRRQVSFLLEQARWAKEEKQFRLAVTRFYQYTSLVPGDTEALAEFGLILADLGQTESACVALEKVLRSQPERDDIRRRLVQVDVELGRYSDAQQHLQQYLLVASPEDGELLCLLGTCQAAAAEYVAAAASFREAIKQDSRELNAYARLADVLRRNLDRPREADQCMEKLVESNPASATAHLLRGKYLHATAASAKARKEVEAAARAEADEALELAPDNLDALVLAAQLALQEGRYDAARTHAKRAIQLAPKLVLGYAVLSQVELQAGRGKEAVAWLKQGLQVAPKQKELLRALASLLIEEGELEAAARLIEQLRAGEDSGTADYLQARLDFARGNWQEAAQGFTRATLSLGNTSEVLKDAYLGLANCYEKLGNQELQLVAYHNAARVAPAWPPARLGIAATLVALGQVNEALEEYRQISQLEGLAGIANSEVVRLLIRKNLRLRPAERNSQENWKEVKSCLDQLVRAAPDAIGVTLLRAEALVGQNHMAEAESLLLAARDKSPGQPELWLALTVLAQRQQQWDHAAQILDEAERKVGDSVRLRLARGLQLLEHHGKDAAAKLRELAAKPDSFSPAQRLRLRRELATMSRAAGDLQQARQLCQSACRADPKDLELHLFLLELAYQSEDAAGMEQVLQAIRGIEGQGPHWHYGEAARLGLLADKGQTGLYDQALLHVATARDLRPAWPLVPLLAARLYERQEQGDLALENYLTAIDLGERSPAAIRRAMELLAERERYMEADQLLNRLEQEQVLLFSDLGRVASEISVRLNQLDRAVEIARQIAGDSKDWRDHLWLGRLLGVLGRRARDDERAEESKRRFAEAEKSLRYAIDLEPQDAATWVGLIQFFVAAGQKAQAEKVIGEAQGKIPAQQAPLALGQCYEALGNLEAAAQQYQSSLAKAAKDGTVVRRVAEFCLRADKPDEAEVYLRRIVAGQVSAKKEDAVWARRALAEVLLARGGYRNLRQAIALVEQNMAAGPSPDDQRAKALLLATQPAHTDRREAIRILEGLVQSHFTAAADVRFVLAQLYQAEKDWPQANRHMRALLSAAGNEPRFVGAYVGMLLQHKEIQEGELWLARLEELAPDDFATARLKAQTLLERRKVDEAVLALRGYLAKATSRPKDRDARVRLVASYLAAAGRAAGAAEGQPPASRLLDEAELLYRDYVERHPDQTLLLVSFLALRGRIDEALTLAEQACRKAEPAQIAAAVRDLLAGSPPDPLRDRRLEKLLLDAAEKHHRAPGVLLVLGDLRMRQERTAEAVELYREIVKNDKTSVVALNNLAMLLALKKTDLEESLRLIESAIDIAGPLPALLDSRASVLLAMGQPQKALADLDAAVSEEPRPNRHFHRALACWRLGRPQDAADALAEAHKLGLKPEQLNPLERQDYQELVKRLEQ